MSVAAVVAAVIVQQAHFVTQKEINKHILPAMCNKLKANLLSICYFFGIKRSD